MLRETLLRYTDSQQFAVLGCSDQLKMKEFVFTENSQKCFQHYIDFQGPTKQHPFPSKFPKKIFKISVGLYTSLI